MNKSKTIVLVLALVLIGLTDCQQKTKSTAEEITALQKQVTADATDLRILVEEQFMPLQTDFSFCDSMLQYLNDKQVDACFEKLQYAQAYLLQFEMVKPIMAHKMDYLSAQLDNLKADLESQYINDSLALVYLDTERHVADTLHEQILYFKDRLGQSQKDLNALKKSWK